MAQVLSEKRFDTDCHAAIVLATVAIAAREGAGLVRRATGGH
jgi:hypothetical protein